MIEVGRDVEGEAVETDPLLDADAHGADFGTGAWLIFADPDAGGGGVAVGVHAPSSGGGDDGVFEFAHVVVEAQAEVVEVEDGVNDELAGAVVGDIAAAVGLRGGYAVVGKECGRGDEVLGGGGAVRERDDRRVVLEEEDVAGNRAAFVAGLRYEVVVVDLEVVGGRVGDVAEVVGGQAGSSCTHRITGETPVPPNQPQAPLG